MALTCSLLGHDFDDYEVVREREERGSEVVTSIREVAVCDRCGAERILSENTEVTSIVDAPGERSEDGAASDFAPDDAGEVGAGFDDHATDDHGDFGDETVGDTTVSGGANHTEVADDEPDLFIPSGDAETSASPTAAADTDHPVEGDAPPADDGAEVVEDDGEAPDVGGLDEVAEHDDVTTLDEGTAEGTESEGDGAEGAATASQNPDGSDDDGAIILTDDPDQREYGEWPAHDDQQYRPWDPDRLLDDPDAEEDPGPTVAEVMGNGASDADVEEAEEETDDGPEFEEAAGTPGQTMFRCPNCGFAKPAGSVSLRAGDVCPDCRAGYLVAERNP